MHADVRFRRTLGIIVCLAIMVGAPPAFPAEIAILMSQGIPPYKQAVSSFTIGVGKTTTSVHDMNGDQADGGHFLKKAVEGGARLIVAVGTKAAAAASAFTDRLPVLALMAPLPENALGLGAGGFGITISPDPADQFALLHELLPGAKTVGVIYDPKLSGKEVFDGLKTVHSQFQIVEVTVSSPEEVPGAFRRAVEASDAIWLVFDETVVTEQSLKYLFELTLAGKIPVFGFSKKTVQKGALFTAYSNYGDIGAQAAELAQKALAGKAPTSIGYMYPEKSGYYINRRIAEHLKIPPIKRFGGVRVEYHE